jgi:hypothetical protein
MVQNLLWATVYNVLAIPVAAGVFIRLRLDLPMSLGAMAMSFSTIIVALNAQFLRRLNLGHWCTTIYLETVGSLEKRTKSMNTSTERAVLAGGCFWACRI